MILHTQNISSRICLHLTFRVVWLLRGYHRQATLWLNANHSQYSIPRIILLVVALMWLILYDLRTSVSYSSYQPFEDLSPKSVHKVGMVRSSHVSFSISEVELYRCGRKCYMDTSCKRLYCKDTITSQSSHYLKSATSSNYRYYQVTSPLLICYSSLIIEEIYIVNAAKIVFLCHYDPSQS